MKNYRVYQQIQGMLIYVQAVTADTQEDALRIAKQKNIWAPIIGEPRDFDYSVYPGRTDMARAPRADAHVHGAGYLGDFDRGMRRLLLSPAA